MTINVNTNLYDRVTVLKAAYSFTDTHFIHLDLQEPYYVVSIINKDGSEESDIEYRFNNELLAQAIRSKIMEETKTIRELILARAFASTIIEEEAPTAQNQIPNAPSNEIFTEWFSNNND